MGKKKTLRGTYQSKGERKNQVNGIAEMRAARSPFDRELNKLKAWRAGKNPWITIKGPGKHQEYVRVRANTLYGDPKKLTLGIYSSREKENNV